MAWSSMHAFRRSSNDDLRFHCGVLADETITAAELNEGDVVSVIYDPQAQNRVLEIYVH